MSNDDNNIDDIKEKLKKKRQDTEYVGYTAKTSDTKDEAETEPENKEVPKKETPEDTESSLTIEHYKDFEDKKPAAENTKDKKNVTVKNQRRQIKEKTK